MTIESQLFTTEAAARKTWMTEWERTALTQPITDAQIRYIMALIWNGHSAGSLAPASTDVGIPTKDDLKQYNKAQASEVIDTLKESPQSRYGLGTLRRCARSKWGYGDYLGDLSDLTADK